MKVSPWAVVLWFSLIISVWIVRGLPWNLDEYDQAKQAYTSYEMVERGSWWYQHTPRQNPATKPPLVGWMSAGIYQVTHSWDVAWRLPSLAAAAGIFWLLWKSGMAVAGMAGAFLATAAFSWNLLALRLATMVRTDMMLAFLIFAAGWLIWRRLQTQEKWTWRDTVWLTLVLIAATMTKGPIYHAFLLPGLVAWLVLSRANGQKTSIAVGYLIASAVALLPFLLWMGNWIQLDPAVKTLVVDKEFLGRFTTGKEAVHNTQTWYFYLPHLLTKLAPWSLLLLVGLLWKKTRTDNRENAAILWLVCWFLGGLLAMTLVPSKRVDRIFPIVPVLALCLAAWLPSLRTARWLQPRVLLAVGALAVVGYGGYAIHFAWQGHRNELQRLVVFGREVERLCQASGWRYSVIEGRDEGMLMYAHKQEFADVKTAATELKNGTIHVAVVDSSARKKLAGRVGKLDTLLEVAHPTDKKYSYALVRLSPPAAGAEL